MHQRHLEDPMLRSGLALAGAHHALKPRDQQAPGAEDGLLTAADVAEMDLLDTELAVLSACESGLGDVEIGQAVTGLRTAFQVAGAKTLVMNLWRVDDLATCILITQFFDNLLERRLPRDEALIEAKQHLRNLTIGEMRADWLAPAMRKRFVDTRSPDYAKEFDRLENLANSVQPYSNPYFWAPFILIGKTDPLSRETIALCKKQRQSV